MLDELGAEQDNMEPHIYDNLIRRLKHLTAPEAKIQ